MKLNEYLADRALLLILHLFCMLFLSGFLYVTGSPFLYIGIILASWWLILLIYLGVQYRSRKLYFDQAEAILEDLDQRYLLGEMLPDSFHLEDRIYRDMLRRSNKSVIERIHALENEQKEYQEYIESWVHEIKAPVTGIALFCENNKNDITRKILLENQRTENYIDMVLFYARSENVYKDYLISETDLNQVVVETIIKNKQYLIQNNVTVETNCTCHAFTDGKWLGFILNQLLLNSIKYRNEKNPVIQIATFRREHSVLLTLTDNGIGIPPEDAGRIFEKGFTGTNGRVRGRSTGMGLYLCQKLCTKLGIALCSESKPGEYTKMILEFPVSTYLSKL